MRYILLQVAVSLMNISEKSLELNVGAELLNCLRGPWGMPKAYLQGLAQREEKQQGVDFFAQLDPATRIFAFQFKAPKGSVDWPPYKFTLQREQHARLHALAQASKNGVFYVLPFYASHPKLQHDVPKLLRDTWFLPVEPMTEPKVFGKNKTKIVHCYLGLTRINPEYELRNASEMEIARHAGVPAEQFTSWYKELRGHSVFNKQRTRRMNPWLVRGLRVAIVESEA